MSESDPWYRDRRGVALVTVYVVLTLIGLVVSMRGAANVVPLLPVIEAPASPGIAVPGFVYLYGFMGALAYAFTSLLAKFERSATDLLRVGLRLPAAMLLAAGVYLLSASVGIDPSSGARMIAGGAFLVGLYVNLALKSLGEVARRLYGGERSDGSG